MGRRSWGLTLPILALLAAGLLAHPASARTCDPMGFGAKADGKTKDTKAIQAAIDDCAAKGGGTVTLAYGTYLSAPIVLKSNITLEVKHDATLLGSPDHDDYPQTTVFRAPGRQSLISAVNAQNITITGTGIIDPVFTIGDLSTVWLVAYVRESEAPKVRAGQQLDFTVLAYPKTTFKANIDHVAASLDPSIRRLLVRATIDNSNGQFKPEMFTSVTIYTDEGDSSIGVPRDAVIYEADNARVWVARADKTVEVRQIKTGITRGGQIQVLQGLQPGEIVVTKGSLFVDQAAGS